MNGLAHRQPADAEDLRQLALGRESRSRRDRCACADQRFDPARDLLGQRLARHRPFGLDRLQAGPRLEVGSRRFRLFRLDQPL